MDDIASITMVAVGDISLGMGVRQNIGTNGVDFVFANVLHELGDADLRIGNLEMVFPGREIAAKKECGEIWASNHAFPSLARARFNVLTLANNHIMDSGTAGLINTINLLDGEKILHTGAHINSRKASEPAILDLGILTMGVISCADDEGQIAGRNSPGVAEATEKNVLRAVAALKNRVDVIILCLHMGLEFEHYPDSYKVSLARKSASAGANVILCHHPHVLQGIEVHNGSLICYSLANYVFHVHGNAYQDHCLPYSAWSVMVKIKLSKAGYMSHVLVPVVLGADHRPSLVQGPDRERIIDHIERISMPLHDGECIERLYRSACKRCARENYWWFRGFLRANKFRLVGKRFWILINRSPQRRWIAGYFRHLFSPLTDSFRKNSVDNRLLGYRPINWEEKTGE